MLFTLPVKDKSQAAGKRPINWRVNEANILNNPRPKAWKTDVNVMPIAARGK